MTKFVRFMESSPDTNHLHLKICHKIVNIILHFRLTPATTPTSQLSKNIWSKITTTNPTHKYTTLWEEKLVGEGRATLHGITEGQIPGPIRTDISRLSMRVEGLIASTDTLVMVTHRKTQGRT